MNEDNNQENVPHQDETLQLGITTTAPAVDEDETVVLDHETLKYSLLGPSLTKAGQDTVDQKKVGQIGDDSESCQ